LVFPDDLDTTSLGTVILDRPPAVAHQVMDKMLHYRNRDGIIQVRRTVYLAKGLLASRLSLLTLFQTYFSDFKNRVDPVVCCNVLSLFYKYGRGEELPETLNWVYQVLKSRAYIHGTAFYPNPEAFLYFFYRLLQRISNYPQLNAKLRALLCVRLQERIGVPVDVVSLAMRLIALNGVGISDPRGLKELIMKQEEDGGWEMGTLYQYGSKKLPIGNRGTATALAIEAIKCCKQTKMEDEDDYLA
jgi:hypothetical protein